MKAVVERQLADLEVGSSADPSVPRSGIHVVRGGEPLRGRADRRLGKTPFLAKHRRGRFAARPMKSSLLLMTAATASALAADKPVTIEAQPSWKLATESTELAVTRLGGMMAPVTFFRDTAKPVRPYHLAPWLGEKAKHDPPLLGALRGDWFCLPFGGNGAPFQGEKHPPHGEAANGEWRHVSTTRAGDVATLTMAFETKARAGRVTKTLSLIEGANVVYSRNVVEGFAGPAPLGHHATLALPETEGAVRIATSPIRFGMTNAGVFSDPVKREYQSFASGAKFADLAKVPLIFKDAPDADVTRLPARRGYADLLQLVNEPGEVAWTTATRADESWLWFALKDPAVLNSTVFRIENRGRHAAPWNGRNNCLGLEDVTGCFADGLAASAGENALTKEGVATALTLSADRPTAIHYIQGVAKIPAGFDVVKTATFQPGEVTFTSAAGPSVTIPVRHEFLKTGKL